MAVDPTQVPAEDFSIDPNDPELQKSVFKPMDNGTYDLTISEVPKLTMSNNNNRVINFKAIFKDNPNNFLFDSLTVTKNASWRIAQFLLALGLGEEISTSKLCSPEFLSSLVNMGFKADVGTKEILGKKPDSIGKLPIYPVNEITGYVSETNPARPYPVGQITGTAPAVIAYRQQQAVASETGVATEKPLAEAASKMAF